MTTEEAFAWLKTQSNRINDLIEGIEGAENRAIAAAYWVNEFKIAMRNAMVVQEDAMLLSRLDPIVSFNTELQNAGKTMGGDAKFKALVGKAKTAWQRTQDEFNAEKERVAKALEDSCFAAGTLVHTINGLVPIEKIKVGDLVLSKHESGQGEREYKPVTRTFEHDFQNVYYVVVGRDRDFEGNRISDKDVTNADYCRFLVTGNHPFYKKRADFSASGEWEEIQNIGVGHYVELLDGDGSTAMCNPVFHSRDPGVAFVPNHYHRWDDGGVYFNYLPAPDLSNWRATYIDPKVNDRYEIPMTVYNFEVQDNHTYYVGTIGVWVHNKKAKVLSEQQLSTLTGKDAGKLHVAKESFQRNGTPTDSQAYALKTRGAQQIEGGVAAPVIEFETPLEGKANSVSLDYVVPMADGKPSLALGDTWIKGARLELITTSHR